MSIKIKYQNKITAIYLLNMLIKKIKSTNDLLDKDLLKNSVYWIMNKKTLQHIRKLSFDGGRFIWIPCLSNSEATILGFKIKIDENETLRLTYI